MASLSSPQASSAPNTGSSILAPPTLLIRAPTFRKPDKTASRPQIPPDLGSHSPPNSQLRQPSPTPSNTSRYSIDIPTYDDYEHIAELPSPPRALSPYRSHSNGGGAHSRSASVPHNDYLDPEFLDLTNTTTGRFRSQTHQRSRTELLPQFVSQTLQRTLSRSPARSSRNSPQQSRSPSPEKLSHSWSASPEKRPTSALSVRGGGLADIGGLLSREEMPLTGDGRVSAAARRRTAASGSSVMDADATPRPATPASPAPAAAASGGGVKGLGSWISGAAASVSASVTQSIGPRPGIERQRSDSQAASIRTISGGIQRRDSIRGNQALPATPTSATKPPSSLRPALQAAPAPSFGGAAKATFTSLFSLKAAPPAPVQNYNPEDDELCAMDLLGVLPPPMEGTGAEQLHRTAMSLLRKFQGQYKTRTQQVQSLKQEAEVRDEELEGHTVRSKSLKAQLEAMSRTVQERDDALRERDQIILEREQALKEVTEELRQNNAYLREIGPETPLEELDAEEAERRRGSRTTEDAESVHGSIFSGMQTAADTPITNTTTTSSASSIRSTTTPRPDQCRKPRLSLLSSEDLERQPSIGSGSSKTVKERCENCHGATSSQAWIALSSVRSENQGLKGRLGMMEESIDGVLTDVKTALREGI